MKPTVQVDIRHDWSGSFRLEVQFTSTSKQVAISGPSGAGKSTILSAVAGLFRPEHARICIDGAVLTDTDTGCFVPPQRRRVGLVLQDGWLFPRMSVRANLCFGQPESPTLKLVELARQLEIAHLLDRWPRHLSGGERQRVALGRAILSEPSLLLCDEPLRGLDAPRRDRLIALMKTLRTTLDLSWLIVSHDPVVVHALATDVAVLDAGRLSAQGTPRDVLASGPGGPPQILNT